MNVLGVVLGIITIVFAFVISKFLVDLLIPESDFEEIEAIGKWAKEELKRRGATDDGGCWGCKYLDFWNDGSAMCTKNIDKACISNGFKYRELQ